MEVTSEYLHERYSSMNTEELVNLCHAGGLSDLAITVLEEVVTARGLDWGQFPQPSISEPQSQERSDRSMWQQPDWGQVTPGEPQSQERSDQSIWEQSDWGQETPGEPHGEDRAASHWGFGATFFWAVASAAIISFMYSDLTVEWPMLLLLLLPLAAFLWVWAGKALPPASVVQTMPSGSDGDVIANDSNNLSESSLRSSDAAETGESQVISEGRIASDHYFSPPPLLETVRVRAFILQSIILAMFTLAYLELDLELFGGLRDIILRFPFVSEVLATIAFLIAIFVGAWRQLNGLFLSRTAAVPMVDKLGNARFAYVGPALSLNWRHSAWLRASTWVAVSTCSLAGAIIGSVAIDNWLAQDVFVYSLIGLLVVRWFISLVPSYIGKFMLPNDSKLRIT